MKAVSASRSAVILLLAPALAGSGPVATAEPAERLALAPPVVIVRLRPDGRLPDTEWVRARVVAAREMAGRLAAFCAHDAESTEAALRGMGVQPADLFETVAAGEAEVLHGRRGETVTLLAPRDALRRATHRFAAARYRRGADQGWCLVTFGSGSPAPRAERVRALAERLGVDGVTLWAVGEPCLAVAAERSPEAQDRADRLLEMGRPLVRDPGDLGGKANAARASLAVQRALASYDATVPVYLRIVRRGPGRPVEAASMDGRGNRMAGIDWAGRPLTRASVPVDLARLALADAAARLAERLGTDR